MLINLIINLNTINYYLMSLIDDFHWLASFFDANEINLTKFTRKLVDSIKFNLRTGSGSKIIIRFVTTSSFKALNYL